MVQFQYGPPTFWGWDDFKVVASPQIISGPSPKITIRWPEISHRTWHKGTIGHHLRPWGLNPTKSDKVESRVAVTLWGLKHVDDTKVRAQKLLEHLTTELHVPKPNHGRSLTSSLHLPYMSAHWHDFRRVNVNMFRMAQVVKVCSDFSPHSAAFIVFFIVFSSCFPVQLAILQAKSMFPRSSLGSWQDPGLGLRWPTW